MGIYRTVSKIVIHVSRICSGKRHRISDARAELVVAVVLVGTNSSRSSVSDTCPWFCSTRPREFATSIRCGKIEPVRQLFIGRAASARSTRRSLSEQKAALWDRSFKDSLPIGTADTLAGDYIESVQRA
jgi:hypothetical protein